MGKLVKQLELDALGPSFLGPLLLLTLILTFSPCLNASFFKISSGSLTSLHQPNCPRATSNSLRLSKTSTPHKSPWPTFQPFLFSPPWSPCPSGSSYRRLTFGPYPKSKRLEWQGSHGVSLLTQLILLTSQTKNKITVILETEQIAQMTFCFLTGIYLLKATRPAVSRPLSTRPQYLTTG